MSKFLPVFLFLFILGLAACSPTSTPSTPINVVIEADGKQIPLEIAASTSVLQALEKAGIKLDSLDRVEPESFTLITDPMNIRVIRVKEEFEVEEQVIPFEHQSVQNESLPKGQTLLIQPGENGSQQVTYRKVLEDGIQKTRSIFQTAVVKDPVPEITMVGVQAPFTPLAIPGRIVYLIAGNAWVMDGSTGQRRPVVTTGDLDGRVFSISREGRWLLFTRKADPGSGKINSLYAVDIAREGQKPIDLDIDNVIHHAEWVPFQENTFSYSTVEPREAPPGWQANNDLWITTFTSSGEIIRKDEVVGPNSGGTYGWWGTEFSWSPDGKTLAYARPDTIGIIEQDAGTFLPLQNIVPFDSLSDWAWIPPIAWSPDSQILFFVDHGSSESSSPDGGSPDFGLSAILLNAKKPVRIVPQSGMFSYPAVAEIDPIGEFLVAYLQAVFPTQSDTSRYKIITMDRDGSNKSLAFPPDGSIGIEPQKVIFSPEDENGDRSKLAFLYQGNIWFVDLTDFTPHQVTGDGLITRMDWR